MLPMFFISGVLVFALSSAAHADDSRLREGRINLGGFLTDGNTDKRALVLDGIGKTQHGANRYTVGGEFRYAEDQGVETENEHRLYTEYDRFLNEQLFVGGRIKYESDDIANLDYRLQVGPYIGYQFYNVDALHLSTRGGLDYITSEFADGDKEDFVGLTWGLNYDQRFFNDAIQAFYKHDVSLPLNDAEAFLYDGETGVRFPVANVLVGSVQVDFDWNNAPAEGATEGDVIYSFKLGYEF